MIEHISTSGCLSLLPNPLLRVGVSWTTQRKSEGTLYRIWGGTCEFTITPFQDWYFHRNNESQALSESTTQQIGCVTLHCYTYIATGTEEYAFHGRRAEMKKIQRRALAFMAGVASMLIVKALYCVTQTM